MKMTNREYAEYVKKKSPNSPFGSNLIRAFVCGGLVCAVGQALLLLYKHCGLAAVDAGSATSVTMVFLGAFLTGLGIYDRMAKFAGAGTLVPITGFANSIVSPAMEFKSEGFVTGMAAKMFIIAGPVLVFGVAASVLYGLILVFFRLA